MALTGMSPRYAWLQARADELLDLLVMLMTILWWKSTVKLEDEQINKLDSTYARFGLSSDYATL